MPRQHLEVNSLVTYLLMMNCLDLFSTLLVYALHIKKSLFYLLVCTCILLQEMQEEARKKKPKEIIVSSSSRLAG